MRDTLNKFYTATEQQFVLYNELYSILLGEREALKSQDSGLLTACVKEKEMKMMEINEIAKQRLESAKFIAKVFGAHVSEITMSFLVEVAADEISLKIATLQSKYKTLIAEIAELNYTNALLTEKVFYRNDGILNIFRSAFNKKVGTYSNKGKQKTATGTLCPGVVC